MSGKPKQNKLRRKGRNAKKKQNGMKMATAPSGRLRNSTFTISKISERVCAVYDAFCPAAKGAKIPDQNSASSFPYQTKAIYNVGVDAAGTAMVWVNWDPRDFVNVGTIAAGLVTAWTTGDSGPFYTQIQVANISQWRVVSAGLKFKTTQAWSVATGSFIVTDVGAPFVSGIVGQSVTSMTMGRSEFFPIRDADITFLGGVRGTENTEYKNAYGGDTAINGCILSFSGAVASATIGSIEVVVNWECIASTQSGFAAFASPAASHDPTVMDARARVPAATKTITGVGQTAHDMSETLKGAGAAVNEIAALASTVYKIANSPAGKMVSGLMLA